MFAKIINGEVVQYPYTELDIKKDNPNILFFFPLDEDVKREYNIHTVHHIPVPSVSWNQKVVEGIPLLRGDVWVQNWIISNRSADECNELGQKLRKVAYQDEADPLFFKAQRGEATMQQWLDKVEEIKQRYTY